jgi:glycoprotein endo-alpha-1,2-mannosidase
MNQIENVRNGGLDGFYTYFASDKFTAASSWSNWPKFAEFAEKHDLLFIPSVGPGYHDERIRPWNSENTKSRDNGKYYDRAWESALAAKPYIVSITSYNEVSC